jgi:hypothetical protein
MSSVHKIVSLKEYVDFAISLKEMDEVKKGFPIPSVITFTLDKKNHEALQIEILRQKNMPMMDLDDEFEVELYDIIFKFIILK